MMVGEVRDPETARMALHAAGTGHLILSTLHSNNSTACIQRLRELVDDVNMLSASLLGVVAQRLVRRNCTACGESYTPSTAVLREWFDRPVSGVDWLRGRGCEACNWSGFSGRVAVAELWAPTQQEAMLINKGASVEEIREAALTHMHGIGEDGLAKAVRGSTTLEEVLRVLPYDEVQRCRMIGFPRTNIESSLPEAA
jgi:type IV pilus assembly protein PilB